jgi:hypothetical protein
MGRPRWTTRLTVESCLALDVADFRRAGMIPTGPLGKADEMTWRYPSGVVFGRLHYATLTDSECTAIYIREQTTRLQSAITEIPEQRIELTASRQRLGGERFWFYCSCWRQVGKVYLPPGEVVFRCRRCYNLIHRSAQQHDHRVYVMARDPWALETAFESPKPGRRLLAVGAHTLQLIWARKRRLANRLSA